LKTAEIEALTSRRPIERFQWPLGLALAALSLGMLLGERRKTRAPAAAAREVARSLVASVAALAGAAVLALGATADSAQAAESMDGALDLYRAGRYEQAYGAFEDLAKQHPGVPNLQFDAGASAYMAKRYDEAVDAFGRALTAVDDPALQARSQYNFGNALFRRGEHQEDPARRVSDWRDAIEHYNTVLNALKTQPPHTADALANNTVYNRDIVQRRLHEALKKPPQPQPQNQSGPTSRPNGAPQPQPNHHEQQPTGQEQRPASGAGAASEPAPGDHPRNDAGRRPDPGSVPNQNQPRQRGDFQAQPGDRAGEPPPGSKPAPGQDRAAGNGGMTPDQARSLLQSLKDEDTTVNLNDDPDDPTRRDEPVLKDW
jgi:Ca-activated chloride channel family protein